MGNTYFKYRSLHRYARVARGREDVEIKSMIDRVLVMRDMLRYVQDVRAVRGMVEAWNRRREVVVGARRIRSEN